MKATGVVIGLLVLGCSKPPDRVGAEARKACVAWSSAWQALQSGYDPTKDVLLKAEPPPLLSDWFALQSSMFDVCSQIHRQGDERKVRMAEFHADMRSLESDLRAGHAEEVSQTIRAAAALVHRIMSGPP